MAPPLVLDTNALVARGFPAWLRGYPGPKILPVVAFTELGLHVRRRGSQDQYEAFLRGLGVEVEWMRAAEARRVIDLALAEGSWQEHARDLLIAAHAMPAPRLLVTDNAKHFSFLGDRARTPAQVMAAHPR